MHNGCTRLADPLCVPAVPRVFRLFCLALAIALSGCGAVHEPPPPPPPPLAPPPPPPPPPPATQTCPDGSVVLASDPCPTPPPPPPPLPVEESGPSQASVRPAQQRATRASVQRASQAVYEEEAIPASGPGDQRVFCDITAKYMEPRACSEAQTIAANARQGLGAVQFPDTIVRGETRMVSFTVRRAAPGESLPPSSPGSMTATHQAFTLKITGRMGAHLRGEGFKIEPDTLQYRDIGISDAARWDWNVTAVKAPHHRLSLTAYMVVEAPDGSTSDSAIIPSKEVDIPVRVTFQQRVSDFADGLIALSDTAKAIIAALTALVVAMIGFRAKVSELVSSLFGKRAKRET